MNKKALLILLGVLALLAAVYFFRQEVISAWCPAYYALTGSDDNFRLGHWGFQCVVGRSW